MTGRRITGFLLAVAGAAGFTACLKSVLAGFRDVIKVDGGYCASGGPYVIAHQCSNGDIRLLVVGIFGGLLAVAVYAIGTAMLGTPASSSGLLAWTAIFGLLGWNFIATHGSVITGVVFLMMAAGGFVVLLSSVTSDLRNPRRPSSAVAGMPPLVRAAVPPGFTNTPPGLGTGWQQSGECWRLVAGGGTIDSTSDQRCGHRRDGEGKGCPLCRPTASMSTTRSRAPASR